MKRRTDIAKLRQRQGKALDRLRAETSDFLDYMGSQVDDARFRSAAAMLRGKKAGRPSVDDETALQLAESYLKSGIARTVHRAATLAALYKPSHQVDTTRDRLRRKLRTKLNKSEDERKPKG